MAKSRFWLYFSSPKTFYPFAGKLVPWFAGIAILLTVIGLYLGLFATPPDYRMGDSYRIIYIHVPAAWMSMFIYFVMALWATVGLVWNVKLSEMMAGALAPTGAMFTFIALWTGAFWGQPTWGTYWVWDARLTSYLILLFLYFGFIALRSAIDEPRRAAKASALLAIVGVVNLPIIYFSVKWWNTLHQPFTVAPAQESKIDPSMLSAMIIMVFAFWMYAIAVVLGRVRVEILEREKNAAWVVELLENKT
jgi:heme exporter protein C